MSQQQAELGKEEYEMNIFEKLNEARIRLQAMKLSKSGENKYAGYRYFDLGDFLPAIQQIFKDVGLCGIIRYTSEIAELVIVDTANPDDTIAISTPMAEALLKGAHPIQNLGAVQTYIRRYLWMTALEIVEHDAIDASDGAGKTAAPGLSEQQITDFVDAITGCEDIDTLKKAYATAYKAAQKLGDIPGSKTIVAAYENRKKELANGRATFDIH